MCKITVSDGENIRILEATKGEVLSRVLMAKGERLEHPCGGRGVCGKCTVLVNGEAVLSCRYVVEGDILVEIPREGAIATTTEEGTEETSGNTCLCLDLGTTTMVLALVSDDGKIIKTVTRNNPQRAFAADVMSRIEYASKYGTEELKRAVTDEINSMIESLGIAFTDKLYVAGNTTMLHLLSGTDPSSMGKAPYTPVFIEEKTIHGKAVGIEKAGEVILTEGISAFVGADVVAGLGYVKEPEDGKYNFLVDLGTNAEVVLYSKDKLYCTAAAAGPCFEGVNISCGMSATEGAIYSCTEYGCMVVGNGEAKGICATGLIDAMAIMKRHEVIDETGFMEEGEYPLKDGVSITQGDVRQFQLAKSAICSAMEALTKKAGIGFESIDKVYVAGGISAKINFNNALNVGLLPKECEGKTVGVNNSCLLGIAKYATEKNDLSRFTKMAEYVDLATDVYFQDLFIENMGF